MSKTELLTEAEKKILQESLIKYIENTDKPSPKKYFTAIRILNPEFEKYHDKELTNKITAERNKSTSSLWPTFTKPKK